MKRIVVPDIGDFKDVPIIELLVALGDSVAKDQTVAIVESDKATLDIPSSEAGMVMSLDVKVGDRISAGSVLLTLQSSEQESSVAPLQASPRSGSVVGETTAARTASGPSTASAACPDPVRAPATPFAVPAAGPKAVFPASAVPSAVPPVMQASMSSVEARVYADDVVPLAAFAIGRADDEAPGRRVHAGPAVRKLARDLGVDLQHVKGTGRRGRIASEDVRVYVKSIMPKGQGLKEKPAAGTAQPAPFSLSPWPKVDFAKFGAVDAQPLSRIRKISGANLHRNWVTIPHVTNHDDADITELESFRGDLNREQEKNGVKVSPLAFVMKACIAALKAFPDFNSSLDGETLILKRYFHIGFAADTPNGLVVPVIQNADQKGVIQIARELDDLASKARAGKLSGADMQGGCFSISSLGGIGGGYFTPIINAPEVAILGIGKAQTRVVWFDGQPQPRLYLPLSLSWDHRVVDGAAAGRFNAYLVKTLSDLRRLLL
jgi:pyruvate dehydrogenase E2 component (dihydrolipoyllysine-residue acetyltransferase)